MDLPKRFKVPASTITSVSSNTSDNDFVIVPSLVAPEAEYLVLINYETKHTRNIHIKRTRILSVLLSDSFDGLIAEFRIMRERKLFDVHEVLIGDGTPYVAVVWGGEHDAIYIYLQGGKKLIKRRRIGGSTVLWVENRYRDMIRKEMSKEKGDAREETGRTRVSNDEELKMCLECMKQRDWRDWFVFREA